MSEKDYIPCTISHQECSIKTQEKARIKEPGETSQERGKANL